MAQSLKRFRGNVENIKGRIERAGAIAVLRGAQPIVHRAKEILIENRHFITGTLHRSINAQLGEVSKGSATALIGTHVVYGKYVEALPDGGFLFRAAEERLAEALRVAGDTLERELKAGAK